MPGEGLEPSCPCGRWILNPLRLPIPPPRHRRGEVLPVARELQIGVTEDVDSWSQFRVLRSRVLRSRCFDPGVSIPMGPSRCVRVASSAETTCREDSTVAQTVASTVTLRAALSVSSSCSARSKGRILVGAKFLSICAPEHFWGAHSPNPDSKL